VRRLVLLITLCLLVPLLPFALWGHPMETAVAAWLESQQHSALLASATIGLLAADIVLPVPSSAVATLAGARLGWMPATACTWLGLTLGCGIGFHLARWWGAPLLDRCINPTDRTRLHRLLRDIGPAGIAVTRAVPVLAEATVLLAGAGGLPHRLFWTPAVLSNLALALAYTALGNWAAETGWLPWALAASIALPLLLTAALRQLLRPTTTATPPARAEE
jgi:membrane protein DedA with SNARE-associated domain